MEPVLSSLARAIRPLAWALDRGSSSVRIDFSPEPLEALDRSALLRTPSPWSQGLADTPSATGTEENALGKRAALITTLPGLRDAASERPDLQCLVAAASNCLSVPEKPSIMGVVNVTPDSFSDGGQFIEVDRAITHGLQLARAGADILDIGGESTRPGAATISVSQELERIRPVIEGIRSQSDVQISIDTRKSEVAEQALEAGASLVNDVSGGRFDPLMLPLVASRKCGYIAMHMQGTPEDMQNQPAYADVLSEVGAFLRESAARCIEAGIRADVLAIDPGIGFGKTLRHNLALLRGIPALRSMGLPVAIGVSRKSFLGELSGKDSPLDREPETQAAVTIAVLLGASVIRVHGVEDAARASTIAHAVGTHGAKGTGDRAGRVG